MHHSSASFFLAAGLLLSASGFVVAGCSDPESAGASCGLPASVPAEAPPFDGNCDAVVAPTFAEVQEGFLCHCTRCHSSEISGGRRGGAPATINYDTYDAAKTAALLGAATVSQGLMPYPDGRGPTDAERNLFYRWALCGTPP